MKYVALDIGNVLVHANFNGFLAELSRTLNISLEEATHFMNRSQKLHDLGLTVMRDELADHLKVRSEPLIDKLVQDWNNCISPAEFMIDKLNTMMYKYNLQIALLSNVGLEHSQRMCQILDRGNFFDKCVKFFSCNVGARKPSLLYYHTFLQLYPNWKGCAYVDDLQENLDASKQFGFRTYRFSLEEEFSNPQDAADKIEEFILSDK